VQKKQEIKSVPQIRQAAMMIPVQFGHTVYGSLHIASHPQQSDQPAISLVVSQLLAQSCSWLLYTLEQSTFLQSQCQHLEYYMYEPLTKREKEVLELMFRGRNQEEIADQLCIAPATVNKHRQHIYERLGVHNERDALLAAYHIGILSLLDNLTEQENKKVKY
jgi:DNA-binding CsgD family transcriptional regulator